MQIIKDILYVVLMVGALILAYNIPDLVYPEFNNNYSGLTECYNGGE